MSHLAQAYSNACAQTGSPASIAALKSEAAELVLPGVVKCEMKIKHGGCGGNTYWAVPIGPDQDASVSPSPPQPSAGSGTGGHHRPSLNANRPYSGSCGLGGRQ